MLSCPHPEGVNSAAVAGATRPADQIRARGAGARSGDRRDARRARALWLALQLYGEFGKPVTARAELSRLRRALPGAIAANPYRLAVELRDDLSAVEELLAAGRIGEALDRYPGPLLPASEVPLVVEARQRLDDGLREAILASGSAELLWAWLANTSGEDDIEACRALVARLGGEDPRRPAAISRLRRLLPPCG